MRAPIEEATNPTRVFAMPYSPSGVRLKLSCNKPITIPSSKPDEGLRLLSAK